MLHVPPFRQSTSYCGPACLKKVLAYYGVQRTEKELARFCQSTRSSGTSGKNIVAAAKRLGFRAFIRDHADFKDLRRYVLYHKIPVIVNWFSEDEGHYAVVVHIDKENIYLQDPELGHLRSFRLDTFKRIWFDFSGDFIRSPKDLRLRRVIVIYPPSLHL